MSCTMPENHFTNFEWWNFEHYISANNNPQMAIDRPPHPHPHPAAPVRVITLNHAEHNDSTLHRFEKGCVLHFCPGPSLLGRKVFLYTNYVITEDTSEGAESAEFVRSQYHGLEWVRAGEEGGRTGGAGAGARLGAGALLDDADVVAEITLARAGPFHYYFVYDTAESGAGPQGSGWFQVAPSLRAGGVAVPLDAVCCQTVLAKCLGPLPRWLPVLQVTKEAGYNMIHFTPVQELGGSNSSYSISDQLKVNPRFCADAGGRPASFADIDNIVTHLRNEWKMLSICDIVLNHTANETAWLAAHPEAAYNARDCPHLRPAALLDAALAALSADVCAGRTLPALPPAPARSDHLDAVRVELQRRLPVLRLHECFQCDAPELARAFQQAAARRVPPPPADAPADPPAPPAPPLRLVLDPQRRRLAATVDMDLALQIYNVHRAECGDEDEEARVRASSAHFRAALDELNAAARAETDAHLRAAVDNCIAGIRYERVSSDGPRLGAVSERHPLVARYFTWARGADALPAAELEALVWGAGGARVCAHNGWVMNADPLEDFADRPANGKVYLRRELIAWGDSVKLRYGARPEDCPFLWNLMREYVELSAELFDGLRLDNCHSTPLHVAEYLLDCARNVKPELFVAAELFTNSDHVDNIYVNRLGITSLIRETMAAWDSHEQGRLVHRFGGRAVGAFPRPARRAASPRVAHALLLDLTHDNPSPILKRSVPDVLATAGVVAMACCAAGSTRGLDELVPHHIHVVDEERLYREYGAGAGAGCVGADTGIMAARRALNALHVELAAGGYSEVFVDQMDADTLAITRHHPTTRKSVIMVARNAFSPPPSADAPAPLRDLKVEGHLDDILLEAELTPKGDKCGVESFVRDPRYITGLSGWKCVVRRGGGGDGVARSVLLAAAEESGGATLLRFARFPPGAVLVLRVAPPPAAAAALATLHAMLATTSAADPLALAPALQPLTLADLNAVLYRCDAEERAATGGGGGAYDVPGCGPLVYAGLQGAASLLAGVRAADDLGHPLCANLRAGDWLPEYTWRRLQREPALRPLGAAVQRAFEPLLHLPRYLQPAYFAALHALVHEACVRAARPLLAAWCGEGPLARALSLTSLQLVAACADAPLPAPAAPGAPSLSAGLPHFATGYMRCWGRDTFIALRGLLLLTGRWEDARAHLLGYGACLRHGLLPNLLDGGRRARYNCRDAVWWWLRAIQQYCEEAPAGAGAALLQAPVPRMYPTDDSPPLEGAAAAAAAQPLHAVMQEALDAHFQGRVFRERGAGRGIDAHMSDAGFTVQLGVRPDSGFVFGGNDHNSGTWMDKMGSSERAGTRGRPATPRDGSAVELVALAYAAARWLQREHAAGRYPHAGVCRSHAGAGGGRTAWSWAQWADTIRDNFERHFWIPAEPSAADTRPDLVHRRAIYKDTVGATRPWADYQLRCNYVLAMAVAPDLFEPRHARAALAAVRDHLLGPLGLKTLDPADWAYRPDYDNADDSADASVAHGYNYHQGPEWLWPLGFYLRARLHFAGGAEGRAAAAAAVLRALGPLAHEAHTSPWRGLPELTNADGAYCAHSCRSQAWSSAVVLEVLRDLRDYRPPAALD